MAKMKNLFSKMNSLNLKLKVRILVSFLSASFLVIGIVSYLSTYSEPTIDFSDDPDYIKTGVVDNFVYINDLIKDYDYYMGLNYTESSNGMLPTTVNKGLYTDNNLVQAKISYFGSSIDNSYTGYVSLSERQNTFVYFKTYPVNDNGTPSNLNDDYIMIELIDNPFTDRPTDKGFNGWVTNYVGAFITLDIDYYVRHAKVPVSYTSNKPNPITINFNANWVQATVATNGNNNWANAFQTLKTKTMQALETHTPVYEDPSVAGYYRRDVITTTIVVVNQNNSQTTTGNCTNCYLENHNFMANYQCPNPQVSTDWRGRPIAGTYTNECSVFYLEDTNSEFEEGAGYYEWTNNRYVLVPLAPIYVGEELLPEYQSNPNMAGYFRLVNIPRNGSLIGYYSNTGIYQTNGTCNTNAGCNYYELIQFYDSNNVPEVINANDDYYYMVTRDTNIIVLTANATNRWTVSKPFTLTSVYNGVAHNVRLQTSTIYISCVEDTVIENLLIYTTTARNSSYDAPSGTTTSGVLYGNYHNLKIGRGITANGNYVNFRAIIGGPNATGSANNPTKYRLIVESGLYNSMAMISGAQNTNGNVYALAQAIYGSDYDRATNNNDLMEVYYCAAGSWGRNIYGTVTSANNADIAMDLVVKSGSFGTGKYDYTAGIYVGGLSYGTHYAARRAKIEGGYIYNLLGGPLTSSNRQDYNDTYMNITGGEIDFIVGGAGRSTTYGNRIISVTGGTVNYSVFGGSNSYSGNSSEGQLTGSTYVYIGGHAIIGNENYVVNGTRLWGAEAGSVFGIGNGNSNSSAIGSAKNSYIVIDGKATIRGNVYGGGNYGATGVSGTTESIILVEDGLIYGSIYGGGNNNGAGNNSVAADIKITMNKGNVIGSIYGGSNALGTIYGPVEIKINGGEVTNSVYGGGRGGYTSNTNQGTFVKEEVNVTIGQVSNNSIPIINGSVFGGSAYGSVNLTTRSTTLSNYPTSVTVNKGIITNVFGGGQGSNQFTPYVGGNVTVTINGGEIGNVYGGNDAAGIPNGSLSVYLNGGVITNTFGGGNNTGANTTNVYLQGATSTNIFGGSNTLGNVTTSNVITTSGTSSTVYGGNNLGGTTGTTNVRISGGNIDTVYGGGERTSVTTASNVQLASKVNTLFGGSNQDGTVTESNILVNGGVARDVYGGNNAGGTTTTTNIDINGLVSNNVYGGGKNASTTTSNIDFNFGYATNLFGGGSEAGVTTTNLNLGDAVIKNIYGGSDVSGNVATSNIKTKTNNNTSDSINVNSTITESNINQTGTTDHASSEHLQIIISNNTSANIGTWDLYLITGPAILDSNWSSSIVDYQNGVFHIDEIGQYWGTNPLNSHGNYSFDFYIHSYVPYQEFKLLGWMLKGYDAANNEYLAYSFDNLIAEKLYGGNNAGGQTNSANIDLDFGEIGNLFGGGKKAITGTTIVDVDGVNILDSIYGGGDEAAITTTTIDVKNSTVGSLASNGNIYGGGNAADVNDTVELSVSETNVFGNVYGGGNEGVVSGDLIATLDEVNVTGNIYGGGNAAAVIGTITLEVTNNSSANNIYGGGNEGKANNTIDATISKTTVANNIYGGGNAADATGDITLIINQNTQAKNIFGGGNEGAVIRNIATTIDTTSVSENIYGGGNKAEVNGNITLDINNTTVSENIYGGGNEGAVLGTTQTEINDTTITNDVYGGGNAANVGSYTGANVNNKTSELTIISSSACNVYGGARAAAVNGSIDLTITDTTIRCSAFGGGNGVDSIVVGDLTGELNSAIVTGNTNMLLEGTTTVAESVYGGGNLGYVYKDANVHLDEVEVLINVFGGGNSARVKGSTNVLVTSSDIGESIYAGGNGLAAIVEGSTYLDIEGTTDVGNHVFGGGNAAATGTEENNNSSGIVNIAGATIGGNVYGGANTSKLYGATTVNIGQNAVSTSTLIPGDIIIVGTVFGGGEANASGSEVYDYSYISVTIGININIDGINHDEFRIGGSIFGSGNASSTTGYSYIVISNYGVEDDVRNNISIQRADTVTLSNTHIELTGASDRTNEYSNELFSLSRIDELKLKNNSAIYMQNGANLLKKFTSLAEVNGLDQKAAVQINDETKTVTRNVNNRLYAFEDRAVNIATNENRTSYGEVSGMTFFGLYRKNNAGKVITALYNNIYDYGETVSSSDAYYFTSGSYVSGLHNINHDTEVDGFYSNNLASETSTELKVFYIEPTPPDSVFYRWMIGEQVTTYNITLTASKYSTLGIKELSLVDYVTPNTSFNILGFNYEGLENNVSLVESASIPRVAPTTTQADQTIGLSIKTGPTGWITIGNTEFLSNSTMPIKGTTDYVKESSTSVASLLFYLYHSKNLGSRGEYGTVTISLQAVTPVTDLRDEVERININVQLFRELYSTNEYEATITPGKQYEMFASAMVNITSTSSFSAYYSMYHEHENTPFRTGDYRALVSSYLLPVNTKITMIDYHDPSNPIYYYYVVTEADYNLLAASTDDYAYKLSKFRKMGSTSLSNNYDDVVSNDVYYDDTTGILQEEFIFIFDFKESNINANVLNNSILLELRNVDDRTLISVLSIEQETMVYNLYYNHDARIELEGNLSDVNFYNGNNFNLTVNTNFIQEQIQSNTVYDTNYYDQKLGIKISIYDQYDTRLTSLNLMGIYFETGGVSYYPRDNGEVRINIAERVANVTSRITVHAENSNLAGGNYRLVIESFGSPDGIYYGLESSDSIELNLKVMESLYGLTIDIPETAVFWNKDTGKNLNDSNLLLANIKYQSAFDNPNIRIKLYRRDYSTVYSTVYNLVDFKDYFSNNLMSTPNEYEYYISESPIANANYYLYMKEGPLVTGTYRLEIKLYDDNTFIGDVYRYIIIK